MCLYERWECVCVSAEERARECVCVRKRKKGRGGLCLSVFVVRTLKTPLSTSAGEDKKVDARAAKNKNKKQCVCKCLVVREGLIERGRVCVCATR